MRQNYSLREDLLTPVSYNSLVAEHLISIPSNLSLNHPILIPS